MLKIETLSACLLAVAIPAAAQRPDWARRGVCYEVFVRSFYDSDGDGIGDLRGLTEKLSYVSDLGATCIWLMPIAQSPSYHGYDVTNYYEVNRDYGTTEDFKQFIAAAHQRGIKVLVDLVLNHMSSEHPFFQSAAFVSGSPYHDWFIWSKTNPEVHGWQHTVWHHSPGADEYYYGYFWSGMPDLNLANPAVQAETRKVAKYWLEQMGVDGFRLDAVAHLFEHGDTLMHHPANHPWLRDYEAYLRGIAPQSFTVGEVSGSTETLKPYYPDQLDSYFEFELADQVLDAVRSGSARGLIAALARAQHDIPPGRWSSFLRNHDQTRTMTELKGDGARNKLAAALLLTLPGVPFIYYGEEIGMTGTKPDPRLRTPMHWAQKPAAGFTVGQAWEPLQPDSFTANVAVQDSDPGSLLNTYRRLVHLRSATAALSSAGAFIPLASGSDSVFAFLRRDEGRTVLVVANLGGTTRTGPTLSSDGAVFPPGRYTASALLGPAGAELRVAPGGKIRGWKPFARLEPFSAYVLELKQ